MIGYLKGKIKYVSSDYIILDCNGVGYKVELGSKSLEQGEGTETEYYIYTHVRENEIRLFGFSSVEELMIFEMLIEVSGVGPKVGIALVSSLGKERIVRAIAEKDANSLKIPGVGLKTANKILLELSDKLKKRGYDIKAFDSKDLRMRERLEKQFEEAKKALVSLGYSARDVDACFEKVEDKRKLLAMDSQVLVKYLLSNI